MSVARVENVRPVADGVPGWEVVLADYLAFPVPIALKSNERYFEREARETPRSIQIGRIFHGRAIRELSDADFDAIVAAGFGVEPGLDPGSKSGRHLTSGFLENEVPFEHSPRAIRDVLLNRPIRDAAFRQRVCSQYGYQCAVTRLRFGDGRGSHEAQAAHIWSVKDGGPDLIYNGISLCGNAHWLLDHYVISIDLQFCLLINQALIPPESVGFLPPVGTQILLPRDKRLAPHARYSNHHRSEFDRRLREAGP